MTRVIGKFSGGVGSYSAVQRYVDQHGSDDLTLLFTDTLCEDQDAYRFLVAGAFRIFGKTMPVGFLPDISAFPPWEGWTYEERRASYKTFVLGLAARVMMELPQVQWLSDGRDPWDVYEAERFLGNSRADPCSKILKRQAADRWLRQNCDPTDTKIIVGIDIEERERFFGDGRKARGLQARMAEQGWTFVAPLCDEPYSWECDRRERLVRDGLWLPRLNQLGFAHNNCGGFCCKGGQGHWSLMLRVMPERYTYSDRREQDIRALLGDVSMLKDRRGGTLKTLTLADLRTRSLDQTELADMGACNCFFGDAA